MITKDEQVLSFGIQSLNQALLGFKLCDFAVLYGHQFCKTLAFHLSVQCQLPREKGGLNSSTIYVDGGNTFNPYGISDIARECGLDPKSALEGIFVSRAFTAYQLSALILETLENALKQYRSKLVLVSDITSLFLDKDVPAKESIEIFKKLTTWLSNLVKKRDIIVVATYFHEQHSRRRILLESVLLESANTTIKITDSTGRIEFTLESHPILKPFTIELLPRAVTLERFVEA